MKIIEIILGVLGVGISWYIPSLSFILGGVGLLMTGIDMSKGNKRTFQLVLNIAALIAGIVFRII